MEQTIWEVVNIKEQSRAQDCSLRNAAGQKILLIKVLGILPPFDNGVIP